MLRLRPFRSPDAEEVSLGVFDNNPQAYNCYKSVGFKKTGIKEEYELCGEKWIDIEMAINKNDSEFVN